MQNEIYRILFIRGKKQNKIILELRSKIPECDYDIKTIRKMLKRYNPDNDFRMTDFEKDEIFMEEWTTAFKDWADYYFAEKGMFCNQLIDRDVAFNHFKERTGAHNWTANKWMRLLKDWCKYTDYIKEMNPREFQTRSGRIIKWIGGKTVEMIYIKTILT